MLRRDTPPQYDEWEALMWAFQKPCPMPRRLRNGPMARIFDLSQQKGAKADRRYFASGGGTVEPVRSAAASARARTAELFSISRNMSPIARLRLSPPLLL